MMDWWNKSIEWTRGNHRGEVGRGKSMIRVRTARRASMGLCRFMSAIAAAALTLLTACTVGPNYVRPAAEIPGAYKEVEGWKVAQPKDHLTRGAWWEIFDDPQLNALEEQANISNQSVMVAEAQFRQARALVQAARASLLSDGHGGGLIYALTYIGERAGRGRNDRYDRSLSHAHL